MSLENINLSKLLKLISLEGQPRISALRAEIRDELRKERGEEAAGADFYSPFWSDAKKHVFGLADLHKATEDRIGANPRRANLYPRLRDGFLDWWNEKRRWTNQPFNPGQALKGKYHFARLDAFVKVNSVLTVVDAAEEERAVYAYCFPEPVLTQETARLGLWLMKQAFPHLPDRELRILDMIRGNTFSIDRYPLTGEEQIEIESRFARLFRERDVLREEYY